MAGALILAAEASLFLLLALDLASNERWLAPEERGALALAALAALLLGLLPSLRHRIPRPMRAAALALGIAVAAAAGLTAAEEVGSRRMLETWSEGAAARVRQRSDLLRGDFRWLLAEITRPFEGRLAGVGDRSAAFAILERALATSRLPPDRYGLALYRTDGQAFAWVGNSTPPAASLLACRGPEPAYAVGGTPEAPRLYAAVPDAFTGLVRVAEFLLRSPASALSGDVGLGVSLDVAPHWRSIEPANIQPVLPPSGGGDELQHQYQERGGGYQWHNGVRGAPTFTLPLLSPAGQEILAADLIDRRGAAEESARRTEARRIAALLLAGALLLSAALLSRARGAPAWRSLVLGSVAVWGVRALVMFAGPDDMTPPPEVYDLSIFASSAFGGLLRSPMDLCLSGAAALAQAWLLRSWLLATRLPAAPALRRLTRGAALVLALVSAAALLAGLHQFLDDLVQMARVDISRVDFDQEEAARLALQTGVFLLVFAGLTFVAGLAAVASRRSPEPPDEATEERRASMPLLPRAAIAVLLATALYVPFVLHAYQKLRRDFFEDELRLQVQDQAEYRRSILRDALLATEDPGFIDFAMSDDDPASPGTVAYRLWSRTRLASEGLASSLRIYDQQGRPLSRFAVNLGVMFEPQFWQEKEIAGGDVATAPPNPGVTLRKGVVHGARWVGVGREGPRLVAMTVVDDYDNVPRLRGETAYLPLLRARALSRTNPELARFEPLMAVFGANLERLYESGGEIAAPSPEVVERLRTRPYVWEREDLGEGPALVLYFKRATEIFALAFAQRDPIGYAAVFLRLALLNGALLLVVSLLARLAAAMAGRSMAPFVPSRSFYARLVTVLLVSALAPLLSLSAFVARFSASESQRDLVASGLASLQTVRRMAEDYLNLPDPNYGPSLTDEAVFYVSRVVHQDITVFRDADKVATSTPELYGSSLLNNRLDGSAYRALYLEREPFRLARARIGDLDYLTLSAPMRIDRQGTIGVVSIPLQEQSRAVARKAEELSDAILIASSLTVALLALVGWTVARRVSGPIVSLARASRRVAAGDLEVRVGTGPRDEIGVLVDAFNRMAESLQKQTHDLSRRREYIETILARATTGVLSIDARGTIITINPAAQQALTQEGPAPAAGRSLPDWLVERPALAPLRRALAQSLEREEEGEATLVLGAGDEARRLRAVFLPFTSEEGALPGRIVILEDVTEIVRSGRLAAWAEMARRIAHEVKNPLTPIQLSVEHVRRLWRASDPRFGAVLQECLDNIQGQVRGLRQMATEFSAYARLPQLRLEVTPVSTLLQDALKAYLGSPPEGVRITQAVAPGLPEIHVDRAVMARVLVNLVENALQAMPEGGRLDVRAEPADGDEHPGIRITVRDTGIGIEPAVLERIFEPYFSTKTGGTGLGLAIARGAVEEHGGHIDIKSRPGHGTEVVLVVPALPPTRPA